MTPLARRDHLFALSLLPFLSPARKRKLLAEIAVDNIGSTDAAFIARALSISLQEAELVRNPLTLPSIMETIERWRHDVIVLGDPDYPRHLAEICDPPFAIFLRGDRSLLDKPAIAVVGSRRASPYGINAARRIASELAGVDAAIVSGMARGIDAAVHDEALRRSAPTIAVLGTGIDLAYPREHRGLHQRIAAKGLLITELPPGSPPKREHFPVRNRIIAGLSRAVIVVEAGERSGSLITARLASEEGREVLAVPGSIFSAGSVGVHRLLQQGAKLYHGIEDLLEEIPSLERAREEKTEGEELLPALASVLELFSHDEPVHLDQAAMSSGIGLSDLVMRILELELRGDLIALPGSRYIRGTSG